MNATHTTAPQPRQDTRTTCPYCGVGCGVIASVNAEGSVDIRGDDSHPANFGRLCSKGSALGDTLTHSNRLLHPVVDGDRVSWDTALDTAASRLQAIIKRHGPESVALYVSGQMLTEDYYIANKLVKGYLGTGNIDTNSRLCMSSAVAGHKRAFGADVVPGCYEDIEQADLVVITGSNLAWCHPVIFQRLVQAKKARPSLQVVVIDPRGTATCDIADQHLALQPGTDVALFNGLLSYLHQQGLGNHAFIAEHTEHLTDTLALTQTGIEEAAQVCGLAAEELTRFYQAFGRTEKVVTIFSQGVNQSSAGTDKVNSIINCHLYTGRIGKPGMGPFSITGQPNAMGGREVGGLSNMLAAHMDLENGAHRALVQQFWDSPTIADTPGLKAVELFEAIHAGSIKAVWIIATNPVVSLPNANRVKEALERCELVMISDVCADTDTVKLANIRLPATGWAEKDGTVTNSERRISRQRGFLPPAGEARADWWILCEVAKRLGYAGFDFASAAEIFNEHARLSAYGNAGERDFDIGGLTGLGQHGYDNLAPIQWPVPASGPENGPPVGTRRMCEKRFFTATGRAQFVPVRYREPVNLPDSEFGFVLNSGRIRDQWHTMTRTGLAARLSDHMPEPFVELHPRDAMASGIRDGGLARVRSRWGSVVMRVRTCAEMQRGHLFVPIHWNDQTASDARIGALVNPVVDPLSGEPEYKHTPASIEPFSVEWHGFVLTRAAIRTDDLAWWARATGDSVARYELAGRETPSDWGHWARVLLGADDDADIVEYLDESAHLYRAALIANDRIESCVFVSPQPDLPSREWLAGLYAKTELSLVDRISLLVGRPTDPAADAGPTVCSCFSVGRNTILRAIDDQGLQTVEAVGSCVKAGTNCGSCVPELRKLLAAAVAAA